MSALVITAKDLLLLVRDRRTAAMLLVLPLSFIAIIGLTTGKLPGVGAASPAVRVAVADAIDYPGIGAAGFEDPPDASANDDLRPSPAFPPDEAAAERIKARNSVLEVIEGLNAPEIGGIRADTPEHWAEILTGAPVDAAPPEVAADAAAAARRLVDRGEVDLAVIFGPSFYRRAYTIDREAVVDSKVGPLARGNLAPLDVTLYSGDASSAGGLRLAVAGLIRTRVGQLRTCREALRSGPPARVVRAVGRGGAGRPAGGAAVGAARRRRRRRERL